LRVYRVPPILLPMILKIPYSFSALVF